MAFYAEQIRRQWYRVMGVDMISWYSALLYDQWWNSLSDEERDRIESRRKQREDEALMRVCNTTLSFAAALYRNLLRY